MILKQVFKFTNDSSKPPPCLHFIQLKLLLLDLSFLKLLLEPTMWFGYASWLHEFRDWKWKKTTILKGICRSYSPLSTSSITTDSKSKKIFSLPEDLFIFPLAVKNNYLRVARKNDLVHFNYYVFRFLLTDVLEKKQPFHEIEWSVFSMRFLFLYKLELHNVTADN